MNFLLLKRSSTNVIVQRRRPRSFDSLLPRIRTTTIAYQRRFRAARITTSGPCACRRWENSRCSGVETLDDSLKIRYNSFSSSVVISAVEDLDTEQPQQLPGRSLLFSLPDQGDDGQSDGEDSTSSDDEGDCVEPKDGLPMFNRTTSSLGHLKTYYLNEHGLKITSADFKGTKFTFNKPGEVELVLHAWHSVFTCPLTGNSYASGTLREGYNALENMMDEDDSSVRYSKKKESEHAAAARTLDAIQFQTLGIVEPRFCEEDPSGQMLSQPQRMAQTKVAPTVIALSLPDLASLTTTLEEYYIKVHGLKISADNYATKRVTYKLRESRKSYIAWTSNFTCPLSGTQYPSGTLRNEAGVLEDIVPDDDRVFYRKKASSERAASMLALDVIRFQKRGIQEPRFCDEDPSVLSQTIIISSQSPATSDGSPVIFGSDVNSCQDHIMNVDVHNSLFDGPVQLLARQVRESAVPACKDSITEIKGGDHFVPGDSFVDLAQDDDEDEYVVSYISNSVGKPPSHLLLKAASNLSLTSASATVVEESSALIDLTGNDDERDYVVSRIPDFVGRPPSLRLLEVASSVRRSVASASFVEESASPILMASTSAGGDRVKAAIDAANAWLTSLSQFSFANSAQNGNPHRLSLPKNDTGVTLLCGKMILAALADANQASPVGYSSGIESIANRVLGELWKTCHAKPDTDTYTFYLRCLEGSNPKSTVAKAENIVDAMLSRAQHKSKENTLPKPNQSTFNALIQISAQVGGTSGRHAKHTDQEFCPDRESFLSVLSSSIYWPTAELEKGGFDPVFAKECIQRMSELAAETGDVSLQPDTQVYNAPLRWTGGPVLWAESRPYARYLPWDNYEQIFSKGLRDNVDKSDARVQEAMTMENWLDMMDEGCVSNNRAAPNIETYEAVIQGWLRTATREGLDRAELVAERILQRAGRETEMSSKIKPRLQTFHPIISAWYHSRDAEGPSRITAWAKRWEETSTFYGLRPDSRIVDMHLTACLTQQSTLLSALRSTGVNDQLKSGIFAFAVDCSHILKNTCNRFQCDFSKRESGGEPLEVILFVQTVRAWENVAVMAADVGDSETVRRAIFEMKNTFALFESIIQSIVSSETSHGVVPRAQDMSLQLEHVTFSAQQFFCTLLGALTAFGQDPNHTDTGFNDLRCRDLMLMEKMTRMIGEFDEIESHYTKVESDRRIMPAISNHVAYFPFGKRAPAEDHFHYRIKDAIPFVPSRYSFLWQVINCLEKSSLESLYAGDIVRLGHLIKDIGSARRNSSTMKEAVDKIFDRVLTGTPHRVHRILQGMNHVEADTDEVKEQGSGRRSTLKTLSRPRRLSNLRQRRAPVLKHRRMTGKL